MQKNVFSSAEIVRNVRNKTQAPTDKLHIFYRVKVIISCWSYKDRVRFEIGRF